MTANSTIREIRTLIAQLELVSHAPIGSYDFAPSEVGRGHRWRFSDAKEPTPHLGPHRTKGTGDSTAPRGSDREYKPRDPDELAAFLESYHRRTVRYFRRRLAGASTQDLPTLLVELRETVGAWRKSPPPPEGVEPERGSFLWKCQIADDDRPVETVKDQYWVSPATVYNYRKKYRGLIRRAA